MRRNWWQLPFAKWPRRTRADIGEGSLEVKLRTTWTDEAEKVGQSEKRRASRQKIKVRAQEEKPRNAVLFQCFVAPEGQKVGTLKRRVREPYGQMRDGKLHASEARNRFGSQQAQSTSFPEHFRKLRRRKSGHPVAQSPFRSQNAKSTAGLEHFWTLRC